MKYLFACDRKPRARKSYAARTGMNSRASIALAAAVVTKPETFEDQDGNTIRVWKSSEMSSYSNADIASTLVNRVAVEPGEMLGTVPPSAIKYCVTKGWLIPNADKTLYRITRKAAFELDLPLRFKGKFNGRKIPFAAAPSVNASKQLLPAWNDASEPRSSHHQDPTVARSDRRGRLGSRA